MAITFNNDFLDRALKLSEGATGMNLYNRMLQQGARSIARNREANIQRAQDVIGNNPALLKEIFSGIGEGTASAYDQLVTNANQQLSTREEHAADRLANIGLAFEQMKERERQAKRDMWSNIIGGGLGLAGSLGGAWIGSAGLSKLLKGIGGGTTQQAKYLI